MIVQVHQLLHFLAGLLEHPKAKVGSFPRSWYLCGPNYNVLFAQTSSLIFFYLGNVLQDGCCDNTTEHSRQVQAALYKCCTFQLEDSFTEVLGSHLEFPAIK